MPEAGRAPPEPHAASAPDEPRRAAGGLPAKRHEARLEFVTPDEASAAAVASALEVEAASPPEGASWQVRADGRAVHVVLESPDLSGLRASLQSVVRLVEMALRSLEA